jgi:hypothetical protein
MELTVIPPTPGKPEIKYLTREWFDISTLTSVRRCPRKDFYTHGLGLRKPGLPTAMDYGTGVHKALPELIGMADQKNAVGKAMQAFLSVWTNEHEAALDDKRNTHRAMETFAEFSRTHFGRNSIYEILPPPDRRLVTTKDHVNDYEIPFGIDIGLPIPLVGRIDAMVRHRDTREIWALEWKTTAQGGAWFLGNFDLNPQVVGYCHALREMGVDCKGTMVEYILSAKVKSESGMKPIHVAEHMCRAFVTECRFWGQFLLEMESKIIEAVNEGRPIRDDVVPRWFTGCAPYSMFGQPGFQCDYVKLCQVDNWESLTDLYSLKRWNPFEIKELVS